ncbi:hypothetical protein CDV55_100414 [Aspergillus turcosus]|uniref:Uncharacterized protein n=1 Tax=Aspergillus turcosus TaxID=1245748 RepID=A0A229WUJ3_9EURO|nr:hypothetical protein CDV55_100414 [Aspergillus turcosus]RLL93702.1 hypothetical protein CFD26_102973 [Aspergillus turcosus]
MEADLLSPEASVLTWLSSSEEQPPTLDEEIRASQKIKDYKATRPDDITKEILAAFKDPSHESKSIMAGIQSIRQQSVLENGQLWCQRSLKIETSDPITHPLPNKNLLEMQWHLNQVIALSGAAEAPELEGDDAPV